MTPRRVLTVIIVSCKGIQSFQPLRTFTGYLSTAIGLLCCTQTPFATQQFPQASVFSDKHSQLNNVNLLLAGEQFHWQFFQSSAPQQQTTAPCNQQRRGPLQAAATSECTGCFFSRAQTRTHNEPKYVLHSCWVQTECPFTVQMLTFRQDAVARVGPI